MSDTMNECVIEWIKGDKVAGVTMPSNTRLKNKIVKLAETHEEVDLTVNEDNSIYARIPVSWVKIAPKREVSDEMREISKERMTKLREEGRL